MRHLSLPLATLLLLPFAAARAEDGPAETWDRVHLSGSAVGYLHNVERVLDGDPKQIETIASSELAIGRMGQTIDIKSSTKTLESAEGAPLRIESTSQMSSQATKTSYTFSVGKVAIATEVLGSTRIVEQDVPAGLVGPARANRESKRLAGTSGETYSYSSFHTEYQTVVLNTMTSHGREETDLHDGTKVVATRIEIATKTAAGKAIPMAPVVWMDAAGNAVKTSVELSGMTFDFYRVANEAEAKATGDAPGTVPDVFLQTLIQEKDPIPVPRRLEEAWIVVKTRKPDAVLPNLADEGHFVTPQEDGSVLVHAVRRVPPADKRGTRPLVDPPAELVDALAPGSMIQSDAPEIVAIVEEVVGGERCAWSAAQRLERWVFEHISAKSMSVAFASALEVCRSKEGDCTEHAVLLAALCRAAGIPARVLMGLVYVHGIWGGHAWNDVWIDGSWYPLDATNGYGFVDPLHLPMAHMVMKEGGASETIQLMSGIGTLDVDIQEVKRDGRRIRVGDPALVVVTEGTYSNRVLGLSFAIPSGFEFKPAEARPGMNVRLASLEGKSPEVAQIRVDIDVMDAPPQEDWDEALQPFRAGSVVETEGTVDGRPSRRLVLTKGQRTQTRVLVVADGSLWVFSSDAASGKPQETALDAFLESVDFDVK